MVCLQKLAIYAQLKATRNGKHLLSKLKMCLLNCVCWGGKAQLLLCRRTFYIMVCFAIFYTFTVTYQVVCRSKGITRTFLVEHHITPCNQLSHTSSNNLLTTWRIHICLLQVANLCKALVLTFPCVGIPGLSRFILSQFLECLCLSLYSLLCDYWPQSHCVHVCWVCPVSMYTHSLASLLVCCPPFVFFLKVSNQQPNARFIDWLPPTSASYI